MEILPIFRIGHARIFWRCRDIAGGYMFTIRSNRTSANDVGHFFLDIMLWRQTAKAR